MKNIDELMDRWNQAQARGYTVEGEMGRTSSGSHWFSIRIGNKRQQKAGPSADSAALAMLLVENFWPDSVLWSDDELAGESP